MQSPGLSARRRSANEAAGRRAGAGRAGAVPRAHRAARATAVPANRTPCKHDCVLFSLTVSFCVRTALARQHGRGEKSAPVAWLWPPRLRLCGAMALPAAQAAALRRASESGGPHPQSMCGVSCPLPHHDCQGPSGSSCGNGQHNASQHSVPCVSAGPAARALRTAASSRGPGVPASRQDPSAAASSAATPRTFPPG